VRAVWCGYGRLLSTVKAARINFRFLLGDRYVGGRHAVVKGIVAPPFHSLRGGVKDKNMTLDPVKTAISWVDPGRILVRGYRIGDLIGRIGWGQAAYLLLVGDLPEAKVGNIVEAILVAVIDHGPNAPSTRAAITVASSGASLSASVGAGVLAITRYHGGAIEDCMTVLGECVEMGLDPYEAATEVVERYRSRGLRIAGIGSRVHEADPRVSRLFQYAEETGVSGPYVQQVKCLQEAVAQTVGKKLPINIDGAIAALLCEIRFPKQAANGLFLMSRVAGLTAHAVEEHARNKPLHTVDSVRLEYDGPPERKL
jgi:citrate synthase